jgi:5'-nucleotidase
MRTILLSNDDGIEAPGLKVLREGLSHLGEIYVVAPWNEMSGASHSMTLRRPIEVKKIDERTYKIRGTPADCVLLSLFGLLPKKPDLIISGINHGFNMGEDVIYSGTVAAAREGVLYGIPAMSVSIGGGKGPHYESALFYTEKVVKWFLNWEGPPLLLNMNVPNRPLGEIRGIRLVRLGTRIYKDPVRRIGEDEFEIGGEALWNKAEGTDLHAVHEGYVALTPLRVDLTDEKALEELKGRFPLP